MKVRAETERVLPAGEPSGHAHALEAVHYLVQRGDAEAAQTDWHVGPVPRCREGAGRFSCKGFYLGNCPRERRSAGDSDKVYPSIQNDGGSIRQRRCRIGALQQTNLNDGYGPAQAAAGYRKDAPWAAFMILARVTFDRNLSSTFRRRRFMLGTAWVKCRVQLDSIIASPNAKVGVQT